MSSDTGFASGDSSGVSPWTIGMLPGGGFGGFGGEEETAGGSTGHTSSASGGETQLGKDTKALSSQVGATQAKADPADKPHMPSREELMAHPEQFGWKPGMTASKEEYAQQYFHETLAKLCYKDPQIDGNKDPANGYSDRDKAFLASWGYKFSADVRGEGTKGNTDSGLYAARFEPIDGKSKMPPIVAFRGSEFSDGMVDWRSDLLDPSVGARQYNAERAAIDNLMKVNPGQKLEVTGHSLGGALAQKAAADHAKDIGAITTFQAPGIDSADAAKFNAANADGHAKVNHHYVTGDVVHRAGEAKLDGNFYEHHVPGAGLLSQPGNIGGSHTANLLHNPGDGSYIGDDKSKIGKRDEVIHHDKDPQTDRPFFEGLRQLLGNGLGGPIEGAITGVMKAGSGVLTGAKEIGAGIKNGFMSAMHGITGGMSTAWDGAKKGGSEMVGGFKEMMTGNFLGGLGGVGKGMLDGAGGLLSGAGQAASGVASGLWEGAKGLGSGILSAGKGILGGAEDLIGGLGRRALGIPKGIANLGVGVSNLVAQGGDALAHLDTGNGVANGLLQAVGGTTKALGQTGAGIGHGAMEALSGIGRGVGTAWDGLKDGGGSIMHGASQILHGSPLAGLGSIGKGIVGGAGSVLKGGADAVGSVASGAWNATKAVGQGVWDAGKSVVGGIGTAGKSIASGVGRAASAAWDGAKNVGGAIAGGAKKLFSGW